MTDSGWLFLYTPVPYLAAMYFVAYRHDLGRLAKPFHDKPDSQAEWYRVLIALRLIGSGTKPPSKPVLGGARSLILLGISMDIYFVTSFVLGAPDWYYQCTLQAAAAVPLFLLLVLNRTGPLPFKPYRDVLPYPRLGTRVRHLGARQTLEKGRTAQPRVSTTGGTP